MQSFPGNIYKLFPRFSFKRQRTGIGGAARRPLDGRRSTEESPPAFDVLCTVEKPQEDVRKARIFPSKPCTFFRRAKGKQSRLWKFSVYK